jgi:hypothetical protein
VKFVSENDGYVVCLNWLYQPSPTWRIL